MKMRTILKRNWTYCKVVKKGYSGIRSFVKITIPNEYVMKFTQL